MEIAFLKSYKEDLDVLERTSVCKSIYMVIIVTGVIFAQFLRCPAAAVFPTQVLCVSICLPKN